MKIEELQRIVLRLSNQMFVRYYLHLAQPNDPQLMGIQFAKPVRPQRKRKRACECGACPTCEHREYMAKYRVPTSDRSRLPEELATLGFEYNEGLKMWTIESTA